MLSDPYSTLEFEKLVDLLRRFVASPLGRARLDSLLAQPRLASVEAAESEFALVGEAVTWLQAAEESERGSVPAVPRFAHIEDVREPLARLKLRGVVLDPSEIRALMTLLDVADQLHEKLRKQRSERPRLHELGEGLPDFGPLLGELAGKIQPDGEISSLASTALSKVRRRIELQRVVVEESLDRFVRKHAHSGALRDRYVTMRNGRTVVPVKASSKGRVDGIVHGASTSGQTVFVEPLDTIVQNNRLVRLREDEQAEVLRILRAMTDRMRQEREDIVQAAHDVGQLEYVLARARFWWEFRCCAPRFGTGPQARILLEDARHPVLEDVIAQDGGTIVPLSLRLGDGDRTMIISGPNAGGKTVVLKCVGILAAMAQAGIPVPAEEAEFPWFLDVLAVIGDDQSISEHLSTFSAHVENVAALLRSAGPDSLAIMDELGTATDPEDGGALAVAVVERLQQSGGFSLVSTHLPELKMHGARTEGVVSAAMGLDDETLTVTYRLHCGVPGQSAGLAMAERNGLPSDVIQRARALKGHAEDEAAEYLASVRKAVGEQERLVREARSRQRELEARRKELEREVQERKETLRKETEERVERLVRKLERRFRDALDAAVRKVRATSSKRGRAAERHASRSLGGYRRVVGGEVDAALGGGTGIVDTEPTFKAGEQVRLLSMGVKGEIVRHLEDGRWEVQAGSMRFQADMADIVAEAGEEERPMRLPHGVRLQMVEEPTRMPSEINVIGMTADEARMEVDRFLDRAVLANRSRLRVVHGLGKNVLRRELWHMLARHAQVGKYYQAEQHEGGAGATIVEVRSG